MSTALIDDRDAAVRAGFAATDWTMPIAFHDYESGLAAWDIKAIVRDGEVIGAVYRKDGEVHASVLPRWRKRWATKGLLNALFAGATMTKVTPGHEYMHGILIRLGFANAGGGTFVKGQSWV